MVIRQALPIFAGQSRPGHGRSPRVTMAIAASIAVHAGLAVYLAAKAWVPPEPIELPEGPIINIQTVTLRKKAVDTPTPQRPTVTPRETSPLNPPTPITIPIAPSPVPAPAPVDPGPPVLGPPTQVAAPPAAPFVIKPSSLTKPPPPARGGLGLGG